MFYGGELGKTLPRMFARLDNPPKSPKLNAVLTAKNYRLSGRVLVESPSAAFSYALGRAAPSSQCGLTAALIEQVE